MANLCPAPLFPDTSNCSSRGLACFAEQCICEEGWIGHGDFVSGSPACQLNVAGVRAIWSIVAIGHLICFIFTARYLIIRPRRSTKWCQDFPIICGYCGLIMAACFTALGIIRAVDPLRTIGTDPAATLLFSIGSASFWTFASILAFLFVRLSARDLKGRNESERRRVQDFISTFNKTLPVGWILCMIACVAPSFILINPQNPETMFGLAATHFVILAVTMFIHFILVNILIPPMVKDIEKAIVEMPDERLAAVKWKMDRFRKEVTNQAFLQACSAGIFGLWPYAQRYSSYEVAIAWLGAAFVTLFGLYSVLPGKSKKTATSDIGSNQLSPTGTHNTAVAELDEKGASNKL